MRDAGCVSTRISTGAPLFAPLTDGPDDPERPRRLDWATLFKRAYAVDVLICPRCRGKMTILSIIDDQDVAQKILQHLGLPARAPPRGRPWRPGQQKLALDDALVNFDGIDSPSTTD